MKVVKVLFLDCLKSYDTRVEKEFFEKMLSQSIVKSNFTNAMIFNTLVDSYTISNNNFQKGKNEWFCGFRRYFVDTFFGLKYVFVDEIGLLS